MLGFKVVAEYQFLGIVLFNMVQRPHKAYPVELAQFHSADYVEFLHRITPDTQHLFSNELARCRTFDCLSHFSSMNMVFCDFQYNLFNLTLQSTEEVVQQILFPYSLVLLRFIPSLALVVPDNLGEDCPVFENLFEFCQIYAGGTIGKSDR